MENKLIMKNNEMRVENAFIKSVDVNFEGGILSLNLIIEGNGWGIYYGGVALDTYDERINERIGTVYASQVLIDLMKVFEVDRLSALVGKPIRVKWRDSRTIDSIGHFIKDDYSKTWFSYEDTLFKVNHNYYICETACANETKEKE